MIIGEWLRCEGVVFVAVKLLGCFVLVRFAWFLGIIVGTFNGKRGVCQGCLGNMRNSRGGINCGLGVNGSKGGLRENVDGLGSEFPNMSGVSMSELLNWKKVLKTVMSE